jgi:hypothetical protein
MDLRYEVDGILEGDRIIRLKEPIPCAAGPVRVVVTPRPSSPGNGSNLAALTGLEALLKDPDDLSPEDWAKIEKNIEEHPLRLRKPDRA